MFENFNEFVCSFTVADIFLILGDEQKFNRLENFVIKFLSSWTFSN